MREEVAVLEFFAKNIGLYPTFYSAELPVGDIFFKFGVCTCWFFGVRSIYLLINCILAAAKERRQNKRGCLISRRFLERV